MMKDNKPYFEELNHILKGSDRAVPSLIIDRDRLEENLSEFQRNLSPNKSFRIVVKSLPSPDLLKFIMGKMNTKKLMVFHQPFLSHLTQILDHEADILLGKPMPVKTAEYYYENLPKNTNSFNPYRQIQWLVDTKDRITQYIDLASALKQQLHLNLEIDVGLHRGGIQNLVDLRAALELIQSYPEQVIFSGFMGYDPHIVKIPKLIRSQRRSLQKSNAFYHACQQLLKTEFRALWKDGLTFNGAGSPTLNLHRTDNSPLNDISAGSCLVKPSTFDIPTLSAYQPACFIATPVLKKFKGTALPGLERFASLLPIINSRHAQSFFIYGGYWKADYVYPKQLQQNSLFGASTNQTMVNAPRTTQLEVDDFVFLRPQQSEFVFLQFGKLLVVSKGKVVDRWSLLKNE